MQNEHETLGEIIKNARIKADITVEDLAAKVGVGERFIYRIENEGKKPSYDILYKLIRNCPFYPIRFSSQKSRLRIPKWKTLSVCCITAMSVLCRSSKRQLGRPWTASPESEKEPMSVEILTGSSALRLCVWLFDDNDM